MSLASRGLHATENQSGFLQVWLTRNTAMRHNMIVDLHTKTVAANIPLCIQAQSCGVHLHGLQSLTFGLLCKVLQHERYHHDVHPCCETVAACGTVLASAMNPQCSACCIAKRLQLLAASHNCTVIAQKSCLQHTVCLCRAYNSNLFVMSICSMHSNLILQVDAQ